MPHAPLAFLFKFFVLVLADLEIIFLDRRGLMRDCGSSSCGSSGSSRQIGFFALCWLGDRISRHYTQLLEDPGGIECRICLVSEGPKMSKLGVNDRLVLLGGLDMFLSHGRLVATF